ncbi:MAG: hypothetical protein FJW20_02495 [Acidimicrobiia bacterium]|nr:hypothetical protein [Acidimicrobiia bacterium]
MQEIMLEHPDYAARKTMLRRYRALYVGGEQLRQNASEYLTRRQKEPLDVYHERLDKVYYENYVGSIIDWYVATLFRREPLLLVEGDDQRGKAFVNGFADNCDRKGTTVTDFFRKQILEALIVGSSYVLVDFPRSTHSPGNRAEEEETGASRAYLVDYTAEQLINWHYDEFGAYEWVVLKSTYLTKDSVREAQWQRETRYFYYDKTKFEVYRQRSSAANDAAVELIDSGQHGLARQQRVPLFELKIPEGLWLMNKAGLLQLEHFNKSNALGWALTMGLFATPVVYSEREWNQIIGESYYIQLGPQDRFGWTEPEGTVYQIAANNLNRLQEEIYRVCYLLSQAGGPLSGNAQSGLSKQRDFAITQEVLRAYGDVVKDSIKRVLRAILEARQDRLCLDVSGMDEFDIGDFSGEIADAERLLGLEMNSETLRKQVYKKLAFKYLCDVRQEVKDQISCEIDKGMERK